MAIHPQRHTRSRSVKTAFQEGVAEGCRKHLPGAVGIVAKGAPLCAIAGYAHFVLGMNVPQTALGLLIAAVGGGAVALARRREWPREEAVAEPADES